ncbi:MAG: YkgJ family cysteine cluster protein [Chitinophagales bacterium]|nr:YkgJ family cysteine cluster protein [Chitinophagales bacterium]
MATMNVAAYTRRAYRKKKSLNKFLKKASKSKKPGILKEVKAAETTAWKEVDCIACANCCKKMTPTYTRKDILRIAAHFKMSYKEFFDKWLEKRKDGDITNRKNPCQFLGKDNKCTIYAIRPDDCAGFPHLHRKDFRYQAAEKIYSQNMSYCPATLVFVEKLEAAIGADL